MSYFNTTNLRGQKLQDAIKKAKNQEDAVSIFLKRYKTKDFTRSEIAENLKYFKRKIDRHSIGRCLTNLLNAGEVEKKNYTRISMYGVGKPEHPYKWSKCNR